MTNQRKIILLEECLEKIKKVTLSSKNLETGGLIYGRMNPNWLKVYDVSGPGENAQSRKYSISMDMYYLAKYTEEKMLQDYYILGTWHSHPSDSTLLASNTDIQTMINFNKKYKLFYAPIFMIVGWQSSKIEFQFYEVKDNEVKEIQQREGVFIIE